MKALKHLIISFFSMIIIVGCGGKEEKKKEEFSYEKPTTEEKAKTTQEEEGVANIVLTADDLMKYNKNEIIVKAGQKVKLTLRHIGKLDVNVMGHNIVILKKDVNLAEFAAKAASERDNKYIPKDSDDIIVHTDLIGGGQVTSVEFLAPEAGTYEFLCSFPAHFAMMRGKFIVE